MQTVFACAVLVLIVVAIAISGAPNPTGALNASYNADAARWIAFLGAVLCAVVLCVLAFAQR